WPTCATFSVDGVEILGERKYRTIDLASSNISHKTKIRSDPATVDVDRAIVEFDSPQVDLSKITISAGPFYLNQRGNLCYVLEATLAGKAFDAFVDRYTKDLAESLGEYAKEDLTNARTSKMPRPSWSDIKNDCLNLLKVVFDDNPTSDYPRIDLSP